MNCRQTRLLISPYLDQELTGKEMLELKEHLLRCAACTQEWREVNETRRLLRTVAQYTPPQDCSARLVKRLSRRDPVLQWSPLTSMTLRAGLLHCHGQRLAMALALSSIAVLAVAPPFAPPQGNASFAVASKIISPMPTTAPFLPEPTQAWAAGMLPSVQQTAYSLASPQPAPQEAVADAAIFASEPLRDQTAVDYVQGNAAFAEYHASVSGSP